MSSPPPTAPEPPGLQEVSFMWRTIESFLISICSHTKSVSSYWVWLSAVLLWYQTTSHSSSVIKWKCVFATVLNYSHSAPFQPLNPLVSPLLPPHPLCTRLHFLSKASLCPFVSAGWIVFIFCFALFVFSSSCWYILSRFFVTPCVFSARGPCLIIALLSNYDLLSQRVVLSSWHCVSPTPSPSQSDLGRITDKVLSSWNWKQKKAQNWKI